LAASDNLDAMAHQNGYGFTIQLHWLAGVESANAYSMGKV
jgi:hypothetical protein